MYDAIIVGARCAGATTALLLARRGHRVLLLERSRPDTDTISTHYIHRTGTARLARLGLLGALQDSGCPALGHSCHSIEGVVIRKDVSASPGNPVAYGPRRYILDSLLCQAAVDAGAEFRHCTVTELTWSDGRVTGVRARTRNGGSFSAKGRVVVGADGMNSTVADLLRAEKYHEQPRATCVYYTYWSGMSAVSGIHIRNRRGIAVVPTHDDTVCVAAIWPVNEFTRIRRDIVGNYLRAVRETTPEIFEGIQNSHRAHRFVGTASTANFYRASAGPGWALVGDAGFHKDSLPANGISDALEHAELLADHIHQGLAGAADLDTVLTRYARSRDAGTFDSYRLTCWLAGMRIPASVVRRLQVLASSERGSAHFFSLLAQALTESRESPARNRSESSPSTPASPRAASPR
ncbi:NAD(P)/FAD-dependent oxidoreductase [Streptomyces noursei]|uniref:NAD(P)/FAD-dependent oxidoreductase n=1 Tax=Streptomyces noursei TaxID=1971 RepID=UPI003826BC11